MNDHTKVKIDQLPKCYFCSDDAKYDAKTKMGPWAYMCPLHYSLFGVGLGLGKGQELIEKVES
jgi:hypothetical protein